MQDFNDKVVVITGGATGIGFGFTKAFGAEGAKIIISGKRENRLQEAVDKLSNMKIEAKYCLSDATKPKDMEALADFAWNTYGHVDALVNNAGIMVPHSPVVDMPLDHLHQIYDVNFFGVVIGSQVFGKRFIKQGTPAAIYNVGSENSLFHGTPFNGAYVATKHGVLAITQSLYEEMPEFIEVGLICPGFVVSELGPEENMKHGMPTDKFVAIAMKQIKAGEFFIVSHAYNMVPIKDRYDKIAKAYETYVPRYDGDVQYDVRSNFSPILEQHLNHKLRKLD